MANALADQTVAEDSAFTYDVSSMCTDIDGDDTVSSLTSSISGAPTTLTIASGQISGTPVNADVGTHTITVTCSDTGGASASDDFTLTVTNTNDAPTFSSTAVTAATEDAAYSYTATASDVDVETP